MTRVSEASRFFASMLLACLPAAALAQDENGDASLIDPAAEERLIDMSNYLAGAETLQFTAVSFFDEIQESGILVKRFLVHEVRLRRPDRFAFTAAFDDGTVREGWYDGTTLTVAMPQDGRYVQVPAPDTIDATLDMVQQELGRSVPLADILYSDVYAAQQPYILSAIYLGERIIQDTAYDHISVESVGADWQLWLASGEMPTPRMFMIHYVEADNQPEYMAMFSDWAVGEPLDDTVFVADIQENWEQVELPPQ